MTTTKVSLRAPAKQSSDDNGIASVAALPRNDNPFTLLEDLKAKQRQYQTLKNEGLILPDHRAMEVKLQETIFELEGLLKEMEGS